MLTFFRFKKLLFFGLIACLLTSLLGDPQPAYASRANPALWQTLNSLPNRIDPALQESLQSLQADEAITVVVTLRERADLSRVTGPNRAARQRGVILALRAIANGTQGPLRALLKVRMNQGRVRKFSSLWVINGFSVTATTDVINELAQHPRVQSITPDEIDIEPAYAAPELNVENINAPALWDLGYAGQGVVVASMDTGVDVNHPDLLGRWRGGSNSWFDPFGEHPTDPTDLIGHGTWTMGAMVGGDAGGTSVGVAPGAQWIAVKIFNDAGYSTATAVHQGFQWLLDPDDNPNTDDAPHVVNNSWTASTPGCNLEFEPDLQALRAAGILPVFAAGNYGPTSNSSRSPANNPSAFPVGNLNDNNLIYGASSRGPSACAGWTGPYPKIVAPGVTIHTTDLFGGYYDPTGTSLAAPHVTGGLALLLSVYPDLTAAEQENALINSAVDLGSIVGPDSAYGYGRLDLFGAFNSLGPGSTPTPTSIPTDTPPSTTDTPTATYTSTFTPTALPTGTPTATQTPTLMATATGTPTQIPTNTSTSTPTNTSAPPPTNTATPSRTATFTQTPTNTSAPPPTNTATPTPTATSAPTPTNTSTPAPTNTATATQTATPSISGNRFYLSLANNQTLGGVSSADEDILKFDGQNWSLFFDGSDVGVGSSDLFAFSIMDADTILLSFSTTVTVNGISAAPQDVLRFDATSLGSVTAGTFSMYFDGSDVGFDTTNENIDSLSLLPDGRLLISTTGNPSVPGLTTGRDEDVLAFTPTGVGNVTSGTWSMYFDGSDVGLADTNDEDVDALDVTSNGNIYLSTLGNFLVNGLSGANEDVFICAPTSIGNTTSCNYAPTLYFDGSTWGLAANDVDAFNFLAY